ncbi:MAG: hypothetical protein R3E66_01495 [bacterium]
MDLPPSRYGQIAGLLGTFNAQVLDDFTPRDASALQSPITFEQLYREFGDSWRVAAFESLFDYEPGESTQTFTDLDFPPVAVDVSDVPAAAHDEAIDACKRAGVVDPWLFQGCVLDALCSPGAVSLSDVASPLAVTQVGQVSWSVDGMLRPAGSLAEVLDASRGTSCSNDLAAVVWVTEDATPTTLAQSVEVQGTRGEVTLVAGQTVFAYTLSFDPQTATSRLPVTGSITFSSQILGLITTSDALVATDAVFASQRAASAADGLEANDVATISMGSRRLDIKLNAQDNVDHIRVIVAAPREIQ